MCENIHLGNWKTLKAGTGSRNGNGNILSGFKMRMRMTLMNGGGATYQWQNRICLIKLWFHAHCISKRDSQN